MDKNYSGYEFTFEKPVIPIEQKDQPVRKIVAQQSFSKEEVDLIKENH
jgi:hypothetical protein